MLLENVKWLAVSHGRFSEYFFSNVASKGRLKIYVKIAHKSQTISPLTFTHAMVGRSRIPETHDKFKRPTLEYLTWN